MKIITVVGARPQFIKAAALSRILRGAHQELIVHTGQHYDRNMSDIFFEELEIPRPDYNLGVAGGSHGEMTGNMLIAIEKVLMAERPDMVLVYGDTNSTLAGALAAAKLHIPVCHVEAGVRTGLRHNPEEINRILTDRISDLKVVCTALSVEQLQREGVTEHVYNTGDLMYDVALYYAQRLHPPAHGDMLSPDGQPVSLPSRYYLLTCHREENTGDEKLLEVLSAMQSLDEPTIYPAHPRNRDRAVRLVEEHHLDKIILTQPVSYLTSLYLVQHALKVVTDSGGLQREAWFYGIQCVTLIDKHAWPETAGGNMNQLAKPQYADILAKLAVVPDFTQRGDAFGDGHAAEKITAILTAYEREHLTT